ncbi:DUF4144 family protein [Moritella sp. F3]|uniref:DUF4144 family protein n=1 Tax=Moritella sp. F3 TaxID=2718882 RepID=UPI0018E1359B|nr:DUF4144 family protein [Moritella sp. F3]GIC78825.1 hypothetical protein FMO001_35520 [Moritella sp. F1]GIC81940.1 hypothetical protein FMO003_22210 [Moritella sp. F3]
MVNWPAVIKYHGEDELVHVESLTEWLNDADLNQPNYETEDRLIDGSGATFLLPTTNSVAVYGQFSSLNKPIQVTEFVELVRKHAAIENYCCSAKINAKTHQQVIAMVKEINAL